VLVLVREASRWRVCPLWLLPQHREQAQQEALSKFLVRWVQVSGLLVSAVGAGDSGSLADYKSIKSGSSRLPFDFNL
jgi:hypothetical protein